MQELPLHRFDAFLFDLDGTLIDSMPIHNEAWIEVLAELGHTVTHELMNEFAGVPSAKTIEIFNARFGWKLGLSVVREKETRYGKRLSEVRPIEPVMRIVREYHRKKPMAIVTGGTREFVPHVLKTLRLDTFFPLCVCSEDTRLHKPHPDPFLLGSELVRTAPDKCLVFEDGGAGIRGAKAAGMSVVRVGARGDLSFLG